MTDTLGPFELVNKTVRSFDDVMEVFERIPDPTVELVVIACSDVLNTAAASFKLNEAEANEKMEDIARLINRLHEQNTTLKFIVVTMEGMPPDDNGIKSLFTTVRWSARCYMNRHNFSL